nr:2-hydroxycarboxylate transporter family protein [Enterococcus hermanniensis]
MELIVFAQMGTRLGGSFVLSSLDS